MCKARLHCTAKAEPPASIVGSLLKPFSLTVSLTSLRIVSDKHRFDRFVFSVKPAFNLCRFASTAFVGFWIAWSLLPSKKSLFWASPRGVVDALCSPKTATTLFVGYCTRCSPSGLPNRNLFHRKLLHFCYGLDMKKHFGEIWQHIQCGLNFHVIGNICLSDLSDFCARWPCKSVALYFCVTPGRLCVAIAAADYSTRPDGFGSARQAGDLCPLFVPAGNSHR